MLLKKAGRIIGEGYQGSPRAVMVGLLQDGTLTGGMDLHVGAEREVHCEHIQAMLTNFLQRHRQW